MVFAVAWLVAVVFGATLPIAKLLSTATQKRSDASLGVMSAPQKSYASTLVPTTKSLGPTTDTRFDLTY